MEHPVHPELPGGDLHCIEPGQSNPLAEDPSAVDPPSPVSAWPGWEVEVEYDGATASDYSVWTQFLR